MRRSFYLSVFIFCILLFSCAQGQVFTKLSSYDAPLSGPYTLLLYSGVYEAQPGSFVILYPQQGGYRFQPYLKAYGQYGQAYGWTTVRDVPGDRAMSEAGRMLAVKDIRTLRVQAVVHKGEILGYQVSPPTAPPGYDVSSYYEISYFLTKDKAINVQVLPSPTYHGY